MPIMTELQRNSLELKLNVSVNPLRQSHSTVDFYSSPRTQPNSAVLIKHRIHFSNGRLYFECRAPKELLFCSDVLPTSRAISLRVKIAESTFRVYIDNEVAASIQYNNLVENVKVDLRGDLFVRDV